MTISMYQASVPVITRSLTNLRTLLEKAVAHAEANKIDPLVLMNARLFPDMFPLIRQVQIATDMAKGGASRLAGAEVPKYEDNESSFAELIARINKTIALLETFKPAQINGSEDRDITVPCVIAVSTLKAYLIFWTMCFLIFIFTSRRPMQFCATTE